MKTEGPHFPPVYGAANLAMAGGQGSGQRREQGQYEAGEEMGEEGEDDLRIGELFQRAELGHPFGYRRDVNLLMDVICDRLSSRLCHRCVRQTSHPICPRLASSEGESCQCQKSDETVPILRTLVQGREQITQTTPNRCEYCNVILCNRTSTKGTFSKPPQHPSTRTKDINLRQGLVGSRNDGHLGSELLPCHSRRVRFLTNCVFLENKFKQGMAEKARTFARGSNRYKPLTTYKSETEKPYQPPGTDNATSFSKPSTSKDKGEKPVYIKGTNPLLDKIKFSLQNDEETKHEFLAQMYQEDDTPSPLLPPVFETPGEFENRTVGATRHSKASPVDLLRKRLSLTNNGRKTLDGNVKHDKQMKTAGNKDKSREITETEIKDGWKYGVPLDIDPSIYRQLMLPIPRAVGQNRGRNNALIGFADKISHEVATEETPYKSYPSLWKQTYEQPSEKLPFTIAASIPTQSFQKEDTSIEHDSTGDVKDRGIQAVPSALQAQTQTYDNTSQQETQTDIIGSGIKTTLPFGTGKDCRRIHAEVCTQTSKTSQQSFRQQPFSLNTWTQTTQSFPNGTGSERVLDQKLTTENLPSNSDHSSDWSSVIDSDCDDDLPLNPKNTIEFYKQSFKRLKKTLAGGRDVPSSDSDGEVDHRVGRVLKSSHVLCSDSSWSAPTGSSHAQLHAHAKTTRTRSFQFGHPVLRDVLGEPLPSKHENIRPEEKMVPPPDFLECYHESDMAAFFELHHLDVPVSFAKRRGRRVNRQSENNSQRSNKVDLQREQDVKSEQMDGRLDQVTSKLPPKTTNQSPPMMKKPEFHQGALNQFDAKEGTRRLSWRDQAPVSRKAEFFKVEADIASETKASEEKRKMSALPETSAVRRISLFEGMALN